MTKIGRLTFFLLVKARILGRLSDFGKVTAARRSVCQRATHADRSSHSDFPEPCNSEPGITAFALLSSKALAESANQQSLHVGIAQLGPDL